jgi:hypothetical protein
MSCQKAAKEMASAPEGKVAWPQEAPEHLLTAAGSQRHHCNPQGKGCMQPDVKRSN